MVHWGFYLHTIAPWHLPSKELESYCAEANVGHRFWDVYGFWGAGNLPPRCLRLSSTKASDLSLLSAAICTREGVEHPTALQTLTCYAKPSHPKP